MKNQDGTWKQDIDCIVDPIGGKGGIFISNLEAASNPLTLQRHRIGAVITAAKGQNLAQVIPKHIEYLYLPAVDHESFDISQYFQASYSLINQQSQRTNVLVHCMAGVSRSASLVLAFLIRARGITLQRALSIVKGRRKIICPNDAFLEQLLAFQKRILTPQKSLQQSTTSSWYSPTLTSQNKASAVVADYDAALKQRIHKLFLSKQGLK